MTINSKKLFALSACVISISISGCGRKIDGSSASAYYTIAFQCGMENSDTGWCFATPSMVYQVAEEGKREYALVGKGAVQDYIAKNGKICVANIGGCASVYVSVKDRQ